MKRFIPSIIVAFSLLALVLPAAQITQPPAGYADLLFTPDATYDIGKTGATRPRDFFASRNGAFGGTLAVTGLVTAPGVEQLLKANSGTSTSAVAANLDTVAISGLTALDHILVYSELLSATQATAGGVSLYNSTDGVLIGYASLSLIADETGIATSTLTQSQNSSTSIISNHLANTTTAGPRDNITVAAVTQAWTGSWTLAIRTLGTTAGGTLRWKWAVYRVPGQ